MEHIKTQSGGLRSDDPEHGHEESDINVPVILGFGAFLLFSAIVIHVLLWGMYRFLDKRAEKANAAPTPVAQQVAEQRTNRGGEKSAQTGQIGRDAETAQETVQRLRAQFPTPRLQDDDVRDMNALRSSEDKLLNSYTWIDKNNGAVRIPVSRAMRIIAERGLPSVAPQTAQSLRQGSQGTAAQTAPKQ